jgi:hypothetical protein
MMMRDATHRDAVWRRHAKPSRLMHEQQNSSVALRRARTLE